MKNTTLMYLLLVLYCLLGACDTTDGNSSSNWLPPAPGKVIDSLSEPVTDDTLNKFTATIKIVADSNVASGVYEIETEFGPNLAINKFSLPKGMTNGTPKLKKTNEKHTYIIGFLLPDDTTFYDYYQVSFDKQTTKMQYIKSYYYSEDAK
jgi:hypothetical protein